MSSKVTILSMMQEMETWVSFTHDELAKAKVSKINSTNNEELAEVVRDWSGGAYDEDPETVRFLLLQILNK